MRTTGNTWTDEMNALLRVLHEAGDSFWFIAEALNREFGLHLTRNAIIGRSHRLGLIRREKDKPARIVTKRRRSTPFRLKPPPPPPNPNANLPPDQSPCAVTFMRLGYRHCRWPIDVPNRPIMYCGAQKTDDSPYCYRHHQISYTAPPRSALFVSYVPMAARRA